MRISFFVLLATVLTGTVSTTAYSAPSKIEEGWGYIVCDAQPKKPVSYVFYLKGRIGETIDAFAGYSGADAQSCTVNPVTGPDNTLLAYSKAQMERTMYVRKNFSGLELLIDWDPDA